MFELFGSRAEDAESLETLMRTIADHDETQNSFPVSIPLKVPLVATVIRDGEDQTVYLRSSARHVSLKRNTDRDPGDLSVSCPPDGERVSINSINIPFRNMDDIYTDRGIVWVHPGTPAIALFSLTRRALDTTGLIAELAEAAVRAVDENVFRRFTDIVH